MSKSETVGLLLLESVRNAVRKNRELAAEMDQLKQRIKILEDRIGPGA